MTYKLSDLLEGINNLTARLDQSEVEIVVNTPGGSRHYIDNTKMPVLSLTTTNKTVSNKLVVKHVLEISPVMGYDSDYC